MKSILDPLFRYRPSFATDVRDTFERLRREKTAASDAIPATSLEQSIGEFACLALPRAAASAIWVTEASCEDWIEAVAHEAAKTSCRVDSACQQQSSTSARRFLTNGAHDDIASF